MAAHSHSFVENYDGFVGFGYDRDTDEKSLMVYLQKFSDDELLDIIIPRFSDDDLNELFTRLADLMKNHLSDREYHRLFLKDE